jgi:hypothetical protein
VNNATKYLKQALREAHEIQGMQPLLRSMMWFGEIFRQQGDLQRAVTVWSFINLHESVDGETRNDTELLLAEMIDTLSTEAFVIAIEASKKMQLDAIVDDLLDY